MLINKALNAPIENPRRKLMLVALAIRANRSFVCECSALELARIAVIAPDHLMPQVECLDGVWCDVTRLVRNDMPVLKFDLTRLFEFDDFGGVA